MTHLAGNVLHLEKEPKQQCDLCGKIDELRPYGPNGECICFECGMKDKEATLKQFALRLAGQHPIDKQPKGTP